MRPADVLPPTRDGALVAATLGVILLTWVAATFAGWRGREDALEDWRYFLANLSEMAAQHADQTLAAADAVLGRVVGDVNGVVPVDDADLVRKTGTRATFDLLRRRQGDLPQIDVISIVGEDGRLINFSRSFPTPTINLADRDYLKAHRADDALALYLSAPVQNRGWDWRSASNWSA